MAVDWSGIAPNSKSAMIKLDGVVVGDDYVVRWFDGTTPITPNVTLIRVARTYAQWTDDNNVMHIAERGHYYSFAVQSQIKYCPVDIYYTAAYARSVGPSFIRSAIQEIITTANAAFTTIEVGISNIFIEYDRTPDNNIKNVLVAFTQYVTQASVCGAVLFDAATYGTTVGVAYLGTACTNNGRAIVSVPATYSFVQALVFSHELGHIFNAQHVESYPACSTETTIMKSDISGSELRFSTCAQQVINNFANTCLSNTTRPEPPSAHISDDTWIIVGVSVGVALFVIFICGAQWRQSVRRVAAKQKKSRHAFHTSAVNALQTG
jgi:hypothetical protein